VPKSAILTVQVPLLRTIEERKNSAICKITAKLYCKTIHLIAHSMACPLSFLDDSIVN